jgi:ribokinase
MFDKLTNLNRKNSIVVMPDFFVDRIIRLESQDQLFNMIAEKAKYGGGSLRGIPTFDIKGGNAVNIAYCLAKLGANVTLFTIADEIGSAILEKIFSKFGDSVNLRITNGKHGRTTALEFVGGDEKKTSNTTTSKVNLMISDVGDNENFGSERIASPDDMEILKNADAVMVVNWASNLKGTQLTEHVFKNSPHAFHFIDPADVENRKEEFSNALYKLANMIDVLSLNENECNSLGRTLDFDSLLLPSSDYSDEDIKNAAKKLADKFAINVEIHTSKGSAWSNGLETAFFPAIKVEVNTLTGAGDSWDAANILGYLAGLDAKERLIFSNAYASLYVKSPYGEPAIMNDVVQLLERIFA